jgi:hypothetical protein
MIKDWHICCSMELLRANRRNGNFDEIIMLDLSILRTTNPTYFKNVYGLEVSKFTMKSIQTQIRTFFNLVENININIKA